ncbi:hypothetical protein [Flavobacterium sp. A45]|uniref:hypothetical protein n=1 Tax=Flavobacterium sp. A45 TaxID=1945862 RepID=UPI000987C4F9|nr:hypothetical protein [Flavobacterium sp. A45]OOG76953.1 hypothetical protein B0E44_03120 [Flavobacterium sp. A45]
MTLKKAITILILVLISTNVFSQAKKLDKIITKDYQVIECTISKISDKTVDYSMPNETMIIEIAVSKIARIDYASGRSQTFAQAESVPESAPSQANNTSVNQSATFKQNTIAVLPVPFVNSENMTDSEEMSKFAQNDIYNKLLDKSSHIVSLTVQDLRTTNSLLRKAGIDYKNIDETPIDELQKILGVDNIIAAKVSYTVTQNQTTAAYTSQNAKVHDNKVKANESTVANTNTQLLFDYHVYFDMYKNNTKIYTQNRKPLLNLKDSWMDTVSYLLKRSPIYVK